MSKIQLLDQNTINQIAAGEVIDRPASIVKELTENAIDAGATMITVEIKDGGTSLIRVTDNGSGISKDDVRVAFLRHSTSKIRTALDLLSVSSLGFRGEALSSIASVCQVELITKTEDTLTGVRYKIEGGKEVLWEELGAPEGTTFYVRNIFFNTPARRKFLKTVQTEAGYISDIMEKLALSHPEISINFINNNQNKLHTPGNGNLKDVIYSIYGKDITNNLIEINCENDLMKMHGFIGKALISKGNRNFESYFINGRYIKSNIINKAIEDGYKLILMQHKYPFTVLNFEMNQDLIDVNVHPAKMELRFRKAESIYPWIMENINKALTQTPNIVPAGLVKDKVEKPKPIHAPEPFEKVRVEQSDNSQIDKAVRMNDSTTSNNTTAQKSLQQLSEMLGEDTTVIRETTNYNVEKLSDKKPVQQDITTAFDTFLSEPAREKHKLIGQVFETYWIIEYENKMYIIDQHAAHEKVMFEKLMNKYKNKQITSQMINPPIILNLSMNESALLNNYIDRFKEIGFEIEAFGGQDYAVRAVPSDLLSLDSEEVLMNLIDNLSSENSKIESELIIEKLASMSCKAAVKGNSKMSYSEANALIEQLLSLDNPYNCPHGRPTIISISKYELEKKFKRII